MIANSATASLAFSLQNDQQKPVIYITQDPTLNKLTFSLANTGNSPLQLKGGTPVAEPIRQAGSPSALYLTLGGLLTAAQFKSVQFVAAGWQATYFTTGGISNWGLTPVSDLTLPAGEAISFTLSKVTATERPGSGFFTIDHYGIGALADSTNQVKVFLQNPPVVGRKELRLNADFSGSNTVILTEDPSQPKSNKLSFYLANPDPTHPIVPASTPWLANPPVFILSFVEGQPPGYGALTTPKLAAGITVAQQSTTGTQWQIQPVPATSNPTWRLLPQSHEILGIGDKSTVEFGIDHIISQLEPGLTSMYLQYANVPGYNDGFLSLVIQKEVPAQIVSFYATPGVVVAEDVPAQVSLHWQVKNATSLEIRSGDFGSIDVSGKKSWKVPNPLKNTTVFTLHATGANDTFQDQTLKFKVVDFKVNLRPVPSLSGSLPWTANYYPNGSYSAKGVFVYFIGTQGNYLAINTKTKAMVHYDFGPHFGKEAYFTQLVTSPVIDPSFDRLYFMIGSPNNGIAVVNVNANGHPTIVKNVKWPPKSFNYLSALTVSPNGQKVYYQNGYNSIGVFKITDYVQQSIGPLPIASSSFRVISISPDGNTLYIGTENRSVLQLDLSSQKVVAKCQLSISKGSGVMAMTLSPDGKQLFIPAMRDKKVIIVFPEEQLRQETIPLEATPFTVAFSPEGALAYVLLPDIDTIAIIDTFQRKVAKTLPINKKTTHGVLQAITVSPDGSQIYLSILGNSLIAAVKVNVI